MSEATQTEDTFLTVAEAAERLGVSAPRLRRLLTRPEWIGQTETRTRRTRTGTRTGTHLNETLLPAIRSFLDSESLPIEESETDRERERERATTRTGTERNRNENGTNGSTDLFRMREELARVIAERDGLRDRLSDSECRIADTQTENARLAEALATSQRLTDQAQQLQLMTERRAAALEAEVEKLKAIEAMPTNSQPVTGEVLQTAQDRDSVGDTVPEAPMEPPTAETAQDGQKRGFWKRLADSFTGGGG